MIIVTYIKSLEKPFFARKMIQNPPDYGRPLMASGRNARSRWLLDNAGIVRRAVHG